MKQTVYVVMESGWDGYRYSADDAHVFTTREDAEKCKKYLDERFKADVSTFITESEVDSYFEED